MLISLTACERETYTSWNCQSASEAKNTEDLGKMREKYEYFQKKTIDLNEILSKKEHIIQEQNKEAVKTPAAVAQVSKVLKG